MFEEEIWSDDMHTDIFFFPSEHIHVCIHSRGDVDLYTTLEFVDHDSSTSTYFVSHGVTVWIIHHQLAM